MKKKLRRFVAVNTKEETVIIVINEVELLIGIQLQPLEVLLPLYPLLYGALGSIYW